MAQGNPTRPTGKIVSLIVLVLLALAVQRGWLPASVLNQRGSATTVATPPAPQAPAPARAGAPTVESLYQGRQSGTWLVTSGRVERLLPDDTKTSDGSDMHQKFLLQTGAITVLVAHNISIAPRVPLKVGDEITLRGQYEWSEKGGTIHFTHHPKYANKNSGWIDHAGKRYE